MILKTNHLVSSFKALFDAKGYKWFDGNNAYNVNLFSIRSAVDMVDVFDDFLYLVYRDDYKQWRIHQYCVTTQSGLHYLKNPLNKKGAAILVPDQYLGVYAIDYHQGKYKALCQRLGKVKVYRDNNRDGVFDYDVSTIEEGSFGINIHLGGERGENKVGRWSAGCTVFQHRRDFKEFMRVCTESAKRYGNKFTYTLFDERDFLDSDSPKTVQVVKSPQPTNDIRVFDKLGDHNRLNLNH